MGITISGGNVTIDGGSLSIINTPLTSGQLYTAGGVYYGYTDFSETSGDVGSFPSSFTQVGATYATIINNGGTEGYSLRSTSNSINWAWYVTNWYRSAPNAEGEILARVQMGRFSSGNRVRYVVGFPAVTTTTTWRAGGPVFLSNSTNNAFKTAGYDILSPPVFATTEIANGTINDGWGWIRMRFTDTTAGKMNFKLKIDYPGTATAKNNPPPTPTTWDIDEESSIAITRESFNHTPTFGRTNIGPNQTAIRECSYFSFSTDPDTIPPPTP